MEKYYSFIENNYYPISAILDQISSDNYICHDNFFSFQCVGIFICQDYSIVVFPKNYDIPSQSLLIKKEIKYLLRTIQKYNRKYSKNILRKNYLLKQNNSSNDYVSSMMYVIEYYIENGLLCTNEKQYVHNYPSTIDWNHTIQWTTPTYITNQTYYLDTISKKTKHDYLSNITLLHKLALYHSFEKIGFLYDIDHIYINSDITIIKDFKKHPNKYKRILKSLLSETFNSKLIEILIAIDCVLFTTHNDINSGKSISFISTNFELVWQDVVADCFGNKNKIISSEFPALEIFYLDKVEYRPQLPDTVYQDSDANWVILDAKYYTVDHNRPPKGDYLKQFFYEFSFTKSNLVKYNVLIFNYSGAKMTYLGKAQIKNAINSIIKDKQIYMIGLNQAFAYKKYSQNQNCHLEFRDMIHSTILNQKTDSK